MFPAVARIFVSSTWIDLQPERQVVKDAIHRMSEAKFIGMEYFGSRPDSTEEASLDEVDRADIYLGIIGGRYGSGITEAEYRRARERNLPCFIYFKDDSTIPPDFRDPEPEKTARLAALKDELYSRHIVSTPFTSPPDLAGQVRDDLHRWFFDTYLSAALSGQATGNIAASRGAQGALRLESGSSYGSVLHKSTQPRITARATPLRPNVRPFRDLLNRTGESETALRTLRRKLPVQFYGDDGIGKTALLRHLTFQDTGLDFPDGVIFHHQAGRQSASDLQQFLFDSFYETESSYKPSQAERLNLFREKRALIVMDDVESGRAEIEDLLNVIPESAFLFAGRERVLFGEGRALHLEGLPEDEALQFMERELGRSITPDEQSHARAICAALKGQPLAIAQTASYAVEHRASLADLVALLGPPYIFSISEKTVEQLPEEEKKILAILSALGGTPIHVENLEQISQVSHTGRAVENLARRNLAELTAFGWRVSSLVKQPQQPDQNASDWRKKIIGHFSEWTERNAKGRIALENSAPALLACIDWAEAANLPREAIKIGRALEPVLESGGRWDASQAVLDAVNRNAKAVEDLDTHAWVLHQKGTLALCQEDEEAARRLLTEALQRRIEMGDHIAASVTRHNLDFLLPPFVPTSPKEQIPTKKGTPGKVPGRLPGWMKFGLIALLSGGAILGGRAIVNQFNTDDGRPIAFRPEALEFSSQPAGTQSEPQTIEIDNTSDREIDIVDVRVGGIDQNRFPIIENQCIGMRLRPGNACRILISYLPDVPALHTADLLIRGDNGLELGRLSLQGEAVGEEQPEPTPETILPEETPPTVEPAPTVEPTPAEAPTPVKPIPGAPLISIRPTALNFGQVQVSERSDNRILVANGGESPLEISRIDINGLNSNRFAMIENNCSGATLAQGRNCSIVIRFAPREIGRRTANLVIFNNSERREASVRLEGTAYTPENNRQPIPQPELPEPRPEDRPERRPELQPRLEIRPEELDFGELQQRSNSKPLRLGLRNTGEGVLRIGATSITGRNADHFRVNDDSCSNKSLTAGASCILTVIFAARSEGAVIGAVEIRTNSPEGTRRIPIRGVGLEPSRRTLTVRPEELKFPDQPVGGASQAVPVRIINSGNTDVSFDAIRLSGSDDKDFRMRPDCPKTLSPNRSCLLSLVFSPLKEGQRKARIDIGSNAENGRIRIELVGTGLSIRREPAGWCCLNGKVGPMDRNACLERKGAFYEDQRTAISRCKPVDTRPTDRQPPAPPKPRGPGSALERRPANVSNCAKTTLSWGEVSDPSSPITYTVQLQARAAPGGWRGVLSTKTTRTSQQAFNGSAQINSKLIYRWAVRATDTAGNSSDFSPFLHFTCGLIVR